jgi:hypothetical protein
MTLRQWWLSFGDGGRTGPYSTYEAAVSDSAGEATIIEELIDDSNGVHEFYPPSRQVEQKGQSDSELQPTSATNADRAALAERAIAYYADIGNSAEPLQVEVIDLLTNILHWCSRRGMDINEVLETVIVHYTEEQDND